MRKRKWRAKTAMIPNLACKRSSACHGMFFTLFIFLFIYPNPRALLSAQAAGNGKLKPKDDYALIFGTVWGPDDRPVYGIKVEIHRAPGKKPHWELYSDHSGEFAQRVPAGEADYIVSANLKGVKTKDGHLLHAQDVTVHVDYDERVDMSLHLAQ
jgi:hypothetical protein